ncbi:MAG: DinB family protein [Actinomycetota bacterium]
MERTRPPVAADERTTLVAFLDYYRETMIGKLDGLTEEQARWKPAETANSLIGMVQHLGYVEKWWFRVCFAGQPDEPIPGSDEDPDIDFKVPDGSTIEDIVAFYRLEYAQANDIIKAASSLDDLSAIPSRKEHRSLRWILVHMIEETARHAGHSDITRELIDGSVGE